MKLTFDKKCEEELRLEHAMTNAIEYSKTSETLIDLYSKVRTEDGYLRSDIKIANSLVVSSTDTKESIDMQIRSKNRELLDGITDVMQYFENDIIHLKHKVEEYHIPYSDRGCETRTFYIEYYLLSNLHFTR